MILDIFFGHHPVCDIMCGILGADFTVPESNPFIWETLKERGNFDNGIQYINGNTLYHRRLKTIGKSDITQPIWDSDKRRAIMHNGNIYNYKSLKESLIKDGYEFNTDCDSEVILHMYDKYGPRKAFSKLRGTFAVLIYDSKANKFIAARDMLGFKPLYFSKADDGNIMFSSTIDSIVKTMFSNPSINKVAENQIENFKYIVDHQLTSFKDIYQVPPGHYVVSDNPYNPKKHSRLNSQRSVVMNPTSDILFRSLKRGTEERLITEQPLIVTISGGIDSTSILQALSEIEKVNMDEIKTINIKFPGYDESEQAERIADFYGTDHNTVKLKETDLPVKRMLRQYGSWADLKGLISELAVNYAIDKNDLGVTILNGNLPDELFGGYSRIEEDNFEGLINNHIVKSDKDMSSHPHILDAPKKLNKARFYFDMFHEVPSYNFRKQDACGSMFALDVRNPYYTINMINYATGFSQDDCYKNDKRKWVLRKMLRDRGVPDRFVDREKEYFEFPKWKDIDLKERLFNIYNIEREDRERFK